MNTIKISIFSLLLIMSTAVFADNYPPTRTYEVLVREVRLPSTDSGTMTVRECDRCNYETHRVTARTTYALNGKYMSLEDFREVIDQLRLEVGHVVNVRRDIQTGTISQVFIYTQ